MGMDNPVNQMRMEGPVKTEPSDEDARRDGWRDQNQRQQFLDAVHELAESIRRLASVIKNQ